jgi:hypothetical protein
VSNNTTTNSNNTNTNSNNTTNNTVNNTFNINVNFAEGKHNFGNERINYLTPEFIRECLEDLTQGLGKMVREVYFNPDYPENHTVRLHSTKQKLMKIVLDGTTSLTPNNEVGRCATTKLNVVLRQYIEPMIDLLTKLSEKEYDADERKAFESELSNAITQLQWIRENTSSQFNKDMTRMSHGRGFTRTCNLVAAHIIGMSKDENAVANENENADANANANENVNVNANNPPMTIPSIQSHVDFEWPASIYPNHVSENSEHSKHSESEDIYFPSTNATQPQDATTITMSTPIHATAFGSIKSELTKENVSKLTKLYAEAWNAERRSKCPH